MKDKAYAKINLSLDINGVREDGYHLISSIMIPIDYYDELEIVTNDIDKYQCNTDLIFDEHNTIVKAINYMRNTYHINDCFKVTLNKKIPMQAGLGGGSSDGACAIRILNHLYSLNMSDKEIQTACLAIGADVLFTYYNKPALVGGIGEQIEFINVKNNVNVVVAKPKSGVSTKQAYDALDMGKCDHPDIEKIKLCLINGDDFSALLGNSLEQPSLKICNDIQKLKNEFIGFDVTNCLMSGSGSSVFGIVNNDQFAETIKNELIKKGYFAISTKFLL